MSNLVKTDGTRIITVFSQKDSAGAAVEVNTAASTWGEFKTQYRQEFTFTNVRGVVRHNKNILEVDGALLPQGEFTMFLFPKKVKSGQDMRTKEEYEQKFGSKKLRSMCSERGLGTTGNKATFAQLLADDDMKKKTKAYLQRSNKRESNRKSPKGIIFSCSYQECYHIGSFCYNQC